MPRTTDNPALDVTTKYGTVTLTFVDPATESKGHGGISDANVAHVSGTIKVNGIHVRVSTPLTYRTRFYDRGDPIAPTVELASDYRSQYNRRVNPVTGDTVFGNDLPDGVRRKLDELWNTTVRNAYEAHPELRDAAVLARLESDVSKAKTEVERLREQLDLALKTLEEVERKAADAYLARMTV